MSRPSTYTDEVFQQILEELRKGTFLAVICRGEGMPSDETVRNWLRAKPELGNAYDQAKLIGEDAIALECLEIADDGSRDYKPNADGGVFADHDHIQRSRLRIDTRFKLLKCFNPKRWGDKIEHAGNADQPVTVIIRKLTDA